MSQRLCQCIAKSTGRQCRKPPLKGGLYCDSHRSCQRVITSNGIAHQKNEPIVEQKIQKQEKISTQPIQKQEKISTQPIQKQEEISTQPIQKIQKQEEIQKQASISEGDQPLSCGAYGCVYKPPLQCQDNTILNQKYQHDLMKVMDRRVASREERISKLVMTLDPSMQYFIPLSGDQCNITEIDAKKTSRQIKYLSHLKDLHGYFLKYGGITLDTYLRGIGSNIDFDMILSILSHLIKGLTLLHSAGVVHLDLKMTNIVMDKDVPKLIDFGLAQQVSSMTPDDLLTFYIKHPPFFSVNDVRDVRILYVAYDYIFPYYIQPDQKGSSADPLLRLFREAQKPYDYFLQVILPNIYKVDVYMLFLIINDLLIELKKHKKNDENKELYTQLFNLTLHCLDPDPNRQYNLDQVIQFIKDNPAFPVDLLT